MKNTILTVASLISFLIAPAPAFALFNVNQGGTGQAFFTAGSLLYGNGTNPIATTTAGTLGYVLQFNGTFPTWVSTSSLGVVTNPGGSDGQVQFNDGGVFGAYPGFTFDKATNRLSVHSVNVEGEIDVNAVLGFKTNQGIEWGDTPEIGSHCIMYPTLQTLQTP
jgi:hypothetical protein